MGRRRYLPQNTPLQKGIASLIRHQLGLSPFTSPLCLPGVLAAPQGFCPPAARSHAVFLPCPAPPRCVFLAPAPSHPIPHGQWYPAPSPAAPQQGCPSTRAPPITWKKKKKRSHPQLPGLLPTSTPPPSGSSSTQGLGHPRCPRSIPLSSTFGCWPNPHSAGPRGLLAPSPAQETLRRSQALLVTSVPVTGTIPRAMCSPQLPGEWHSPSGHQGWEVGGGS